MKRFAICLSVVGAALVPAVTVVAPGGAQQPGPPTGTLDLVSREREPTFKFVDNPPLQGVGR